MITFVTLFLNLVAGIQPIGVTVAGPVARVEYRLDGAKIGEATAPPWTTEVDFGADLAPHVVTARALDANGAVLSSTTQWINVPRPRAEVEIALEGGMTGQAAAARLNWQSYDRSEPTAIALTLDGEPLKLAEGRRAPLPKLDLKVSHFLSAELRFGPEIVTTRDVVFGGGYGSEMATELTGIPLRLPAKGIKQLTLSMLQGRLLEGTEAMKVAAIEEGPAKVVVVSAVPTSYLRDRYFPQQLPPRKELRFDEDTQVSFLSPRARHIDENGFRTDLFNTTADYGREDGGLVHLMSISARQLWSRNTALRFHDAVAVAGLKAAAENRRRAVLVVLPETPFTSTDTSRFTVQQVKNYLAEMGIPLHIWSPRGATTDPAWGETEDISTLPRLRHAFDKLSEDLETQRIAMVEGRHLLRAVQLKPGMPEVKALGSNR